MATLYAVRSCPTGYRMMKFDDLLNLEVIYNLRHTRQLLYCDCPGFQKNYGCKHIQIVNLFISHERMDKGWFYDHDNGKWEKPLKIWF